MWSMERDARVAVPKVPHPSHSFRSECPLKVRGDWTGQRPVVCAINSHPSGRAMRRRNHWVLRHPFQTLGRYRQGRCRTCGSTDASVCAVRRQGCPRRFLSLEGRGGLEETVGGARRGPSRSGDSSFVHTRPLVWDGVEALQSGQGRRCTICLFRGSKDHERLGVVFSIHDLLRRTYRSFRQCDHLRYIGLANLRPCVIVLVPSLWHLPIGFSNSEGARAALPSDVA